LCLKNNIEIHNINAVFLQTESSSGAAMRTSSMQPRSGFLFVAIEFKDYAYRFKKQKAALEPLCEQAACNHGVVSCL